MVVGYAFMLDVMTTLVQTALVPHSLTDGSLGVGEGKGRQREHYTPLLCTGCILPVTDTQLPLENKQCQP